MGTWLMQKWQFPVTVTHMLHAWALVASHWSQTCPYQLQSLVNDCADFHRKSVMMGMRLGPCCSASLTPSALCTRTRHTLGCCRCLVAVKNIQTAAWRAPKHRKIRIFTAFFIADGLTSRLCCGEAHIYGAWQRAFTTHQPRTAIAGRHHVF